MTDATSGRKGHAVLDIPSRDLKAIKIARLLGLDATGPRGRLLEIGCGSGGISRYFGANGPLRWDVTAIDVEDVRLVRDGFDFQLVMGTLLPFPDASFDVVLSNHVIEHVGDAQAQREHLHELRRVLKPEGVAYLAVPNRWMLVEPHYSLPLLSWLPRSIADAYVRLMRKGDYYDCRPLTTRVLEQQLKDAGLVFVQQHGDALRLTFELESANSVLYRWLLKPMPDALYRMMRRAFPTLIYVLRHDQAGGSARAVPTR